MFGYLRTNRDLTLRDYDTYRAYYCGLCHALGRGYGILARAINSFEGTFLALLVDAQKGGSPSFITSPCVASPFSFRRAVDRTAALDFAAAATICGVSAKLQDDVADGEAGWPVRALVWSGRKWTRQAEDRLQALGFPMEDVQREWAAQRTLEGRPDDLDLMQAVEPSGRAYATIVAHTADLAGRPENKELLHELGYELGKVTCLLDSYRDYPLDVQFHRFNALRECMDFEAVRANAQGVPPEQMEQVQRRVQDSLQSIQDLFGAIGWRQHASIVENVLVTSLEETARRVLIEGNSEALDGSTKILGQRPGVLLRNPLSAVATLVPIVLLQGGDGCEPNCQPDCQPGCECTPLDCGDMGSDCCSSIEWGKCTEGCCSTNCDFDPSSSCCQNPPD